MKPEWSKVERIRLRAFQVVEAAETEDRVSRWFDTVIVTLVMLNVLAVVVETLPGIKARYAPYFWAFEVFSVVVFTVEYVLRLWSCTASGKYRHPLGGRLRFALTPLALVDLVAILPFYLPMVMTVDLRFLRALRMFRIFRLFKVARYTESLRALRAVFRNKKEQLLLTLFGMFILLLIASSLMYFAEHVAQPAAFGSIPHAMWWAVSTLTTVGYGDVYPVTPWGKVLASVISCLGIGMFALPAGILSSGLTEHLQQHVARKHDARQLKDAENPADESIDQSIDQSIDEVADKTVEQFGAQSIDQSVAEPPCCPHCGKKLP
jgi:voltage-gated potassium channel